MFLVDRKSVAVERPHSSASSMKLRVRADGQLLELPPGKITIGSGPRCNLRIEAPGVEPLHCLIVHGAEGLRVRRWATDTRLNGATFDDAPLAAGDCLELGGVELDLVDPLAAALDSLAELMPLIEAEKPAGMLPYFPALNVAETAGKVEGVGVKAELALNEGVACDEALHEGVAGDEAVCEEVVCDATAHEPARERAACSVRETETWGEIEYKLDAEAVAVEVLVDSGEADFDPPEFDAVEEISEVEECAAVDEFTVRVEPVADDVVDIRVETFERAESAATHSADAVEIVFQELQAACLVARGRNRKMLAALRELRAEKESLERRIAGSNRQLPELADKMEAWQAERDLTRNEQRELHAELQEVRRQLGEWEVRLAEHLDQMLALQKELETARTFKPAAIAPPLDASVLSPVEPPVSIAAEAQRLTDEPTASLRADRLERPTAAVLGFPVVDDVVLPLTDKTQTYGDSVFPADVRAAINELMQVSLSESKNVDAAIADDAAADPWDLPGEAKVDWSAPAGEAVKEVELAPRAWREVPQSKVAPQDESASLVSMASPNEVVPPAWESDGISTANEASDDMSPFAEFSIWRQGAAALADEVEVPATEDQPAELPKSDEVAAWGAGSFAGAEVRKDSDPFESLEPIVPEVDPNPWAKTTETSTKEEPVEPKNASVEQASFIDRYSHLFADDEITESSGTIDKPVLMPPVADKLQSLMMPARMESKPLAPSGASDDEESIEQYMAKLLQRVRGDSPATVGSQAVVQPTTVDPNVATAEVESTKVVTPALVEVDNAGGKELSAEEHAAEVAVNWEAFTKRAATAPKTDLGALRALANESARRNIGRHETRKYRRDTVTKVIVSTLAGMTSLWLMLDSPNWLDIQFITACLSLIAAAYWAGEAFRALLDSKRAAAYERPGTKAVEKAALPIDVVDD